MRVSSMQLQRQATAAIIENQADVARTQLQLSTGKNILTPSDDPSGSKRILDFQQSISVNNQYKDNVDSALSRLDIEETNLKTIINQLVRVRDLAISGFNGSFADTDRKSVASEMRQRLEQVFSLANSRDGNNEYLFAGNLSQTTPITKNSTGGFTYNGDQGQRLLQVSRTTQVADSDPGSEVFMAIKNGNGTFSMTENPTNTGNGVAAIGSVIDGTLYDKDIHTITYTNNTAGELVYLVRDTTTGTDIDPPDGLADSAKLHVDGGQITFKGIQMSISGTPDPGDSFVVNPSVNKDVFSMIQDAASALEQPVNDFQDRAVVSNALNRFIMDIDQAIEKISGIQSSVGSRLNVMETQKNINEDFVLFAETNLSNIEDLDYAEAASRLQLQLTTYQAAQRSYALVQGLSLFNFIS